MTFICSTDLSFLTPLPPTSILITYKTWCGFSVLLSYFTPVSLFPSSYYFLSSQKQSVMWTPTPFYISVPNEMWRGSLFLFLFSNILDKLWRGLLYISALPPSPGLPLGESCRPLAQSAARLLVLATYLHAVTLETLESF